MHRHRTTVDPIDLDKVSALVTTGPYRYTRNPIYLGMTGLLTAHAIARRSVAALLPVAGLIAAIDRYQIPAEEAALGGRFGGEYAAYCDRVPRWGMPI